MDHLLSPFLLRTADELISKVHKSLSLALHPTCAPFFFCPSCGRNSSTYSSRFLLQEAKSKFTYLAEKPCLEPWFYGVRQHHIDLAVSLWVLHVSDDNLTTKAQCFLLVEIKPGACPWLFLHALVIVSQRFSS